MRRWAVRAALLAAGLCWAAPAAAAVRLGAGADWLTGPGAGAFQLTLAGDTPLAGALSGGGRIGALLETSPGRLGVPVDGLLRLRAGRAYVEALAGPWISFDGPKALRLHAALGFGLALKDVQVGLEVGWLDPSSMIGLRVAVPL